MDEIEKMIFVIYWVDGFKYVIGNIHFVKHIIKKIRQRKILELNTIINYKKIFDNNKKKKV